MIKTPAEQAAETTEPDNGALGLGLENQRPGGARPTVKNWMALGLSQYQRPGGTGPTVKNRRVSPGGGE
mgnify:CR=1 FL=1